VGVVAGRGRQMTPPPDEQQADEHDHDHENHLDGLADGGCVEVWELLSERRSSEE
jgi:hypothetical protein